mmetsp:Transcript_27641/g.60557  ORF Transcript_27641/g.60557 Transcript_27641/m.60557 type:complete len:273 (+) Transcript_27641:2500-3318(+)
MQPPCHHVAGFTVLEAIVGEGPVTVRDVMIVVQVKPRYLDASALLETRGTDKTRQTIAIGGNKLGYLLIEHFGNHLGSIILPSGIPKRRLGLVVAVVLLGAESVTNSVSSGLIGRHEELGALLEPAPGHDILVNLLVKEDDIPNIYRKHLGNLLDTFPWLLDDVGIYGTRKDPRRCLDQSETGTKCSIGGNSDCRTSCRRFRIQRWHRVGRSNLLLLLLLLLLTATLFLKLVILKNGTDADESHGLVERDGVLGSLKTNKVVVVSSRRGHVF